MFVFNTNSAWGFHADQNYQRYQHRLAEIQKAYREEIRQIRVRQSDRTPEERDTAPTLHSEKTGELLPGETVQGMEQTQEKI